MNEEQLLAQNKMLREQVARIERRRTTSQMMSSVMSSFTTFSNENIPGLLAGPEARVRQSTIKLEESLAKMDEREKEAEAKIQEGLALFQRRTDLLKAWLEALS
ncbi:MAG: hypothetical protein JST51_13040 [Armatimonadetes bacterium]|nr:hypothetical protein [Armatimonadota bacterium]